MLDENKATEYELLMEGLDSAIEGIAKGTLRQYSLLEQETMNPVRDFSAVEIKRIRTMLGWTQEIMAIRMGVHKKTVEAWEYGINKPSGPARRLLELYEKQALQQQDTDKEIMVG